MHFMVSRNLRNKGPPNIDQAYDARPDAFKHAVEYLVWHMKEMLRNDGKPSFYDQGRFADAIRAGNKGDVKRFIKKGWADVNASHPICGTPLETAIRYGRLEIAEILIKSGANVKTGSEGRPILPMACARGEYSTIPLDAQLGIIKLLIRSGADVKVAGTNGWTALHIAAFWGSYEIARLLVENGADVNAESEDHTTPLINAVRNSNPRLVKLLLDNGASLDAKTYSYSGDEWSVMRHAEAFGHKYIINILRERAEAKMLRADASARKLYEASKAEAWEQGITLAE